MMCYAYSDASIAYIYLTPTPLGNNPDATNRTDTDARFHAVFVSSTKVSARFCFTLSTSNHYSLVAIKGKRCGKVSLYTGILCRKMNFSNVFEDNPLLFIVDTKYADCVATVSTGIPTISLCVYIDFCLYIISVRRRSHSHVPSGGKGRHDDGFTSCNTWCIFGITSPERTSKIRAPTPIFFSTSQDAL